ncbi:MAG: helix-hairpin-helix domain-containing protein [Phormidesmis sp.]
MIQTTLFPDTFKQQILFDNEDIADVFEQVADLLEAQGDDYYRIRAYREGALTIRQLDRPAVEIYHEEGTAGLQALPHIGQRLALAIEELTTTGELGLLERLLIEVSPEDLFTTVPGIGQVLARRIYRALGINTLEALEQAAHDGSLSKVEGFGRGRSQLVRDALGTMLGRASKRRSSVGGVSSPSHVRRWQRSQPAQPTTHRPSQGPSIELLLEIDWQYRYLAGIGQLRTITPRRFNPEGKRWLPVMRINKDGWAFNALYSNTARAHELDKTHDWVVISYAPENEPERRRDQCTIVTETRGPKRGQRVIRGMAAAAA